MAALENAPHLLVIEDDAEFLPLLQGFLEEEGFGVTPATSLPDALQALEERLFHFVLTDLFYQPGRSPLQSIQPLLAQAAPIPVGVLTAWHLPEEEVAQADLAFLLPKPFDLEDLQRRLHAHVHPTISRPRQHQVVEAFFEALNARDWKRLARLCTPEVQVASLSAPAVAAASTPGGLFSLRATLEERFHRLPGYTIEAVHVYRRPMGAGARYVARWQGSDGIEHRAAGSLHFRFDGERIAQLDGARKPRRAARCARRQRILLAAWRSLLTDLPAQPTAPKGGQLARSVRHSQARGLVLCFRLLQKCVVPAVA